MNTLTLTQRRFSGRLFATMTILSLLLSAFPAVFFVAEASVSDVLSGPNDQNITVPSGYTSGVLDASGHENLVFSFDYDSTKLDGTNDSFTYGWRTSALNTDIDTIVGLEGTTDDEKGSVSVSLPVSAQVSDLEVYVYVTAIPGTVSDEVRLTNITVTGDLSEVIEDTVVDVCANIEGVQESLPSGYEFEGVNLCVKIQTEPTPVTNSCITPDNLGDSEPFVIGQPAPNELSLETILGNNGYSSVDVTNDQLNTQVWKFSNSETNSVTLTFTLLDWYSGNGQAFGYYESGDSSSFVPVFEVGNHSVDRESVPTLVPGESVTVTIPANVARSLGFAINTEGYPSNVWFSEHALNIENQDNLAVYNPSANTYMLAFEDRPDSYPGDNDHNDLVVKIDSVQCNTSEQNNPETYRIDGYKYNQINVEATQPLAGWTINLLDSNGAAVMSTTTDSNGYYYFDVVAGDWGVSETMQTNWNQLSVIQNEVTLNTDADIENCSLNVSSENDTGYKCDFTNEYVGGTDPEPEVILGCTNSTATNYNSSATLGNTDANKCDFTVIEEEDNGRSYSSGTRVRKASLKPLVLGAATTNFCPLITEYMQMGADNNKLEVMKLQLFLNMFVAPNPVTGFFGATTDANVKAFQEKYSEDILEPWFEKGIVPHEKPTGFVYKTTLWKINSIVCPDYAVLPNLAGEDLSKNVDLHARPTSD